MPDTPTLAIPYPAGTDSADGPGAFQALAERAEALLAYDAGSDLDAARQPDGSILLAISDGVVTAAKLDPYAVHTTGDFKESSQEASHGRWLLCDVDRQMTQADVEAELGLGSGDAAAFVAHHVTGTGSMYGAAAAGKVFIPGFRGQVAIHPSPSHPKKGTGSSGGAETVTLTAGQSGLPAHGHTVTDPGHIHTASGANATPAITVASAATGVTAATNSQQPAVSVVGAGTGISASQASHTHNGGLLVTTNGGAHTHQYGGQIAINTSTGGSGNRVTNPAMLNVADTSSAGDHAHWVGIDTQTPAVSISDPGHGHSASQSAHSHAVTVSDPSHAHSASQVAHTHTITVATQTTGLTVNSIAAAPAADAHDNMPPFRVGGHRFLYV